VTSYKLLGVTIDASLKWADHIAAVTSKADRRLWFLKKLKRAGVSQATTIKLLFDLCLSMRARYCIPVSQPTVEVHGLYPAKGLPNHP